jgi:hypothetical protein
MQLIVEKRGFRVLPLLALALAVALTIFIARDSSAVHNDGALELDGNTAFNGGQGANPGVNAFCGAGAVNSTTPVQPPNPPDCIAAATAAAYDWADDGNGTNGNQGVCQAGANNLITENTTSPKGDLRKCVVDIVAGSTADVSYHTGSDKDYQEIWNGTSSDWGCVKQANATNKADLLNAYVVKATINEGGTPHEHFYFGAERDSENGDVFNGFWFLQNPISSDCPPSEDGDFCPSPDDADADTVNTGPASCGNPGVHECGDVLILFNYENGGRIGRVAAYNWQPGLLGCDGAAGGIGLNADCPLPNSPETLDPLCLIVEITNGQGDCRVTIASDDLCGRVNGATNCATTKQRPIPCFGPGPVTTPWAPGCATPGTNCEGPLASPTFSEAGVDLTGLGIEIPCVAAFVAETRSSPSVTATLKDYALGSFPPCALGWEKRDESATGHPLQGGATFTVTPNPFTGAGSLVVSDCTSAPCAAGGDSDPVAGSLALSDVIPGAYTVCETTAPTGYARDNSLCRNVTVSAANPAESIGAQGVDDCANATADEQDFCNRLGSIAWEKRDDQGNLQGGATFTVGGTSGPFACHDADNTGADDANPVTVADDGDGTTSASDVDRNATAGQLRLDRVCLGTYTITETVAPPGFALDDDPTRSITVSEGDLSASVGTTGQSDIGNTDESDFNNRLGGVEWEKRLLSTASPPHPLQGGATFTLGGASGPFACHDSNATGPDDANPVTVVDDTDAQDVASGDFDDDDTAGQVKVNRVCLGTYTITETVAPSGSIVDEDTTRTITVSAAELNPVVGTQGTDDDTRTPHGSGNCASEECDFHNRSASLIIRKEAKNASTPDPNDLLCGATFKVTPNPFTGTGDLTVKDECPPTAPDANDAFGTTGGLICLDNVRPGTYSIQETAAPANYNVANPDTQTNISHSVGTCATRGTSATADVTFENTPLSEIEIIFRSLAGAGVTASTIDCAGETPDDGGIEPGDADDTGEDGQNNPVFDDLDEVYTDLVPGTYNCTIVIDP